MDTNRTVATRWLSIVGIVMGAWLVVAPYVMSLNSTSSYWNEIVIGAVILVLSLYRLSEPAATWTGWVTLIAGLWLIASPYMFNPPESAAFTNAMVVGILASLLGLGSAALPSSSDVAVHHPM